VPRNLGVFERSAKPRPDLSQGRREIAPAPARATQSVVSLKKTHSTITTQVTTPATSTRPSEAFLQVVVNRPVVISAIDPAVKNVLKKALRISGMAKADLERMQAELHRCFPSYTPLSIAKTVLAMSAFISKNPLDALPVIAAVREEPVAIAPWRGADRSAMYPAIQAALSSEPAMKALAKAAVKSSGFSLELAFFKAVEAFARTSPTTKATDWDRSSLFFARSCEASDKSEAFENLNFDGLSAEVFLGSFPAESPMEALMRVFGNTEVACVSLSRASGHLDALMQEAFTKGADLSGDALIVSNDMHTRPVTYSLHMTVAGVTWSLKSVMFSNSEGGIFTVAFQGGQWWYFHGAEAAKIPGPEVLCRAGAFPCCFLFDRVTNCDGVARILDAASDSLYDAVSALVPPTTATPVVPNSLLPVATHHPLQAVAPSISVGAYGAALFREAVSYLHQVKVDSSTINLMQQLIKRYQPTADQNRTLRDVGRLLALCPVDAVSSVETMRSCRPIGFQNEGVSCFLNSAIHLLISSEYATSALVSFAIDDEFTVQRAFVAAFRGLAEATRDKRTPLLNSYFFASFFPDLVRNVHSCVNEALQTTLFATLPVLAFVPTCTADRESPFVDIKTLLLEETHVPLTTIAEAECLVVGVSPFFNGIFNYQSVDFSQEMTIAGATWELKAVIYWAGTDVSFGHYFAVAKRQDSWWTINDSYVSQASGPAAFRGVENHVISTLIYDRV
jgi:hypothetical protein